MVKRSQRKTGILLKIDIYSEDDTFDNSKSVNFNNLRGYFFYKRLPWNRLKWRVSGKIEGCVYFVHPLDDKHETSPEALRPADIVVASRAKNCSKSNH